jgi:DNA-binding CsgD family transcriptional regulator
MARQRPTRRQLEVLRAYIAAGSIAGTAHELGISETTARQHLSGLYRRVGCMNAAQAAYVLGAGTVGECGGGSTLLVALANGAADGRRAAQDRQALDLANIRERIEGRSHHTL